MPVPSVGIAGATSTISRSTGSSTARRAAGGRRFGVRYRPVRLTWSTRATTAGRLPLATSSRERAARALTPLPPMLPRDLELVGLATKSPLQLTDPPLQLPLTLTLVLPGEGFAAALQQLLPPRVIEHLRDLMRPAQLLHRHIASQPGKHDLELLL